MLNTENGRTASELNGGKIWSCDLNTVNGRRSHGKRLKWRENHGHVVSRLQFVFGKSLWKLSRHIN